MQVILKKTKISLTEIPTMDVPDALIILNKVGKVVKTSFISVKKGKQTYKFPEGINNNKDITSVYLRVI